MVDAGMTIVSNTVMAKGQSPAFSGDTRGKREDLSGGDIGDEIDFDFELNGGTAEETGPMEDNPEKTLVQQGRGDDSDENPSFDPEAETQILESGMSRPALGADDETLMPGGFGVADDEATLRKEGPDDKLSVDNIINFDDIENNTDKEN